MRSPLLALLLLCLGLSACGRTPAPPPLTYLSSDAVVMAFGDSLTHGTGAQPQEAYPAVLKDLIGREVVIAATPGDTTNDGLQKLPEALAEHQPDLVLLCLGGNDFLRKFPKDVTRHNLERMIGMIRDAGSEILLIGVPQPALFGLKGHELYEDIARAHDLPLDNRSLAEVLGSRSTKADPIHPNATGYRELAEALAELLRRAGAV